jgi:L-aminopeptidase/D-esterase-like protein
VTVVLPPPGTIGAVDVRGGGPGTRETDALDPTTLVATVDAVCLAGGSAYGLAAADGVMRWCEAAGLGFPVGPPEDRRAVLVPIVPAAVIFDLGRGGDPRARPDADMGWAAAAAAAASMSGAADTATSAVRGSVGAGVGAVLLPPGPPGAFRTDAQRPIGLKGGVGTASVRVPGVEDVVVGALAVVNAAGSPLDASTGRLLGEAFVPEGLPRPPARSARDDVPPPTTNLPTTRPTTRPTTWRVNTTLAVVATNAGLDVAAARRTASAGHDGLARALCPVHTLVDGDTVFALATCTRPLESDEQRSAVQAAAADAVLLAVLDAVLAAQALDLPALPERAYLDDD